MISRYLISTLLAASMPVIGMAEGLSVDRVKYNGHVVVKAPVMLDSMDNAGNRFDSKDLLSKDYRMGSENIDVTMPLTLSTGSHDELHSVTFNVENRQFANATIEVSGVKDYNIYVDGRKIGSDGTIALRPATHKVDVRVLSRAGASDTLSINISGDTDRLTLRTDGRRMFVHEDVMHGTRVSDVSVSPDGRWLLVTYATTREGGKREGLYTLVDARTGKTVRRMDERASWLPTTPKYYVKRHNLDNSIRLVAVDPATGAEETFADRIPDGYFSISRGEDMLIYTEEVEGPKETDHGYQVLEPEDRQPGWRDRSYPAIYNLADGSYQRLTVNSQNVYASDLSADGTKMLLQTARSRYEKRPTTVASIYILDLPTMQLDTIVADGEFIGTALFSPDARKILVTGTPEAFDRIGCTLPEDKVPSMIENELFLIDVDSKDIKPLTRDFDPSVETVVWNPYDKQVYFTAECRDMVCLYRLDPASGKIVEIPVEEELVRGFDLASSAPVMAYRGQSASNPDGLYVFDLKKMRSTLIDRPSADRLADVDIIKCEDWNFVNSRGDTIYGRYYLPDNFDAEKKYPVIVYYYGGCSPTSRSFDSRYPFHAYAALGYVVYVVQPSGATGFGQEFASRHVSTAGQGVAEDIIEGTKKFLEEHPWTDSSKVGCLGASYGGFMTQYLQTVTDIFAAAVSHAGISDHTSYWGEGYWGYSYSEASMGNDYPWSNPDLYVKQSPLYNAHKIHTPILFVHGDSDTNVPVGESIQLFTALKLLGNETALVQIPGENHWILGYDNQKKWQETIFAWFAKYLQDNPDWWEELYPKKNL